MVKTGLAMVSGERSEALQLLNDPPQITREQLREIATEAVPHNDPEHRGVLQVGRQGVGRHLPTV